MQEAPHPHANPHPSTHSDLTCRGPSALHHAMLSHPKQCITPLYGPACCIALQLQLCHLIKLQLLLASYSFFTTQLLSPAGLMAKPRWQAQGVSLYVTGEGLYPWHNHHLLQVARRLHNRVLVQHCGQPSATWLLVKASWLCNSWETLVSAGVLLGFILS